MKSEVDLNGLRRSIGNEDAIDSHLNSIVLNSIVPADGKQGLRDDVTKLGLAPIDRMFVQDHPSEPRLNSRPTAGETSGL